MAEGESSFVAIEAQGTAIVSVDLVQGGPVLRAPRIETDDEWLFVGLGDPVQESVRRGYDDAFAFLVDEHGWSADDAYAVLSAVATRSSAGRPVGRPGPAAPLRGRRGGDAAPGAEGGAVARPERRRPSLSAARSGGRAPHNREHLRHGITWCEVLTVVCDRVRGRRADGRRVAGPPRASRRRAVGLPRPLRASRSRAPQSGPPGRVDRPGGRPHDGGHEWAVRRVVRAPERCSTLCGRAGIAAQTCPQIASYSTRESCPRRTAVSARQSRFERGSRGAARRRAPPGGRCRGRRHRQRPDAGTGQTGGPGEDREPGDVGDDREHDPDDRRFVCRDDDPHRADGSADAPRLQCPQQQVSPVVVPGGWTSSDAAAPQGAGDGLHGAAAPGVPAGPRDTVRRSFSVHVHERPASCRARRPLDPDDSLTDDRRFRTARVRPARSGPKDGARYRDRMDDHALAAALVTYAARLAAEMRTTGTAAERKTSAADLVTAADRAAEDLVRRLLREHRPRRRSAREEGAQVEAATDGVGRWTRSTARFNYVAGLPAWCSAVALEVDGVLRVGAVRRHLPDETWVASDGRTTRDGEPVRTCPTWRSAPAASRPS